MLGDHLDLSILVEAARFLCDLDISDDFEKEELLLDEISRHSLTAAAKELIGAFIAAETAHRSEFRLAGLKRNTVVRIFLSRSCRFFLANQPPASFPRVCAVHGCPSQ